jgi:hypothetical protein
MVIIGRIILETVKLGTLVYRTFDCPNAPSIFVSRLFRHALLVVVFRPTFKPEVGASSGHRVE